uniref:Glutathione S-transferase II n=1 Tax=Ascidia sydneiensis samea TaxID=79730 RepID=A1ILX6_ASCSS|nr:glutathione S-transferase II [Ascidia sydneiensis samea]
MTVKFYFNDLSPPSRSVMMVIRELGVACEVKDVDMMTRQQKTPEFLRINPRGRVPALVDGDWQISESQAIACYLCNKFAKGAKTSLYPTGPGPRAMVDMWLYRSVWINNLVEAYLNTHRILFHNETMNDDALHELKEGLRIFGKWLGNSLYLTGNNVTIADYFNAVAILHLDQSGRKVYHEFPRLKEWISRMRSISLFDEINQPGSDKLTKIIQDTLAKRTE